MITTYQKATRYDPTRTTTLRRAFERQMRTRFVRLRGLIRKALVEDDVFGMIDTYSPGKKAFAFGRSGDKISSFMDWLRSEADKGILEIGRFDRVGAAADQAWTNMYITDSYKRGVMRARYEMGKAGYKSDFPAGELMNNPFHVDRLGVLYTRTYSDLKGITAAMDTQISRVLAQGIADGDNPRLLARKLTRTITGPVGDLGITDTLGRFIPAQRRAEMLARTEILRSHHLATMQEYKNWGLEGVHVQAEWQTAEDARVCDDCAKLEGKVYSIEEAEKLLPYHPNCRCIMLPLTKKLAKDAKAKAEAKEVERPADTFVPAKDIKEVDERLSIFGKVDLGNISLDKKNDILKAAEDVLGRYGIERLRDGYQLQKSGRLSYAHARVTYPDATAAQKVTALSVNYQKTFLSNPARVSAEKHRKFLLSQEKRIADAERFLRIPGLPEHAIERQTIKLKNLKSATRWTINEKASNPLYAVSVHENGHIVYKVKKLETRFVQNLKKYNVTMADKMAVSEYGASVIEELFCEIMAAYFNNVKIPQNVMNAFLETMKGI